MARYDDLNTRAIAYTTFVASILLLIIILLGRALCYSWMEREDERKLADAHYSASDEVISDQKAKLAGYNKVEVEVVQPAPASASSDSSAAESEAPPDSVTEVRLHIPLNKAKELIMQELSQEPST